MSESFITDRQAALVEKHMKTLMLAGLDRWHLQEIFRDLLANDTEPHTTWLLLNWLEQREQEIRQNLISDAILRASAAMQKRSWTEAYAAFDQVDLLEGKPPRPRMTTA